MSIKCFPEFRAPSLKTIWIFSFQEKIHRFLIPMQWMLTKRLPAVMRLQEEMDQEGPKGNALKIVTKQIGKGQWHQFVNGT